MRSLKSVLIAAFGMVSLPLLAEQPTLAISFRVSGIAYVGAVSPDFKFAALRMRDSGEISIVDLNTQSEILRFPVFSANGLFGVFGLPLTFTPDSSQLLIGQENGNVDVYDLVSGHSGSVNLSPSPIHSLEMVHPTGRHQAILLVTSEHGFYSFEYPSFFRRQVFPAASLGSVTPGYSGRFVTALHSDGSRAAIGDKVRGEIRLLDLNAGREILNGGGEALYSFGSRFKELRDEDIPAVHDIHPVRLRFTPIPDLLSVLNVGIRTSEGLWIQLPLVQRKGHFSMQLSRLHHSSHLHAVSADGTTLLLAPDGPNSCAEIVVKQGFSAISGLFGSEAQQLKRGESHSIAISDDGNFAITGKNDTLYIWRLP